MCLSRVRTFVAKCVRRGWSWLAAGAVVAGTPAESVASPGNSDLSFGSSGIATTTVSQILGHADAMAVQPDGKILVAGAAYFADTMADFALARYNADGTLDTSFGDQGVVTTDFAGQHDLIGSIVVQADGKILAAGTGSGSRLARYLPNGTLDATFGTGGKVMLAFGGGSVMKQQSDGKIVLATGFEVTRLLADGTPDPNFGTDGIAYTTLSANPQQDYANDLAIQADGKIVLAGQANGATGLVRFLSDGNLDPDFGTGGKVLAATGKARRVGLLSDGKIITAGTSGFQFVTLAFKPDGTPDETFNSTGVVLSEAQLTSNIVANLLILPDDTILVGGSTYATGNTFNIYRDHFNTATASERLFSGGKVGGFAAALALQGDGKLLVVSNVSGGRDFVTARLETGFPAPLLQTPAAGSTVRGDIPVAFMLPVNAVPGSVKLTFTRDPAQGGGQEIFTLGSALETVGAHQFYLHRLDPVGASNGAVTAGVERVASASGFQTIEQPFTPPLADATYTFTLAYRDPGFGFATGASQGAVTLENRTMPPTLTAPAAGSPVGDPVAVEFTLPETAAPGTVALTFTGGPMGDERQVTFKLGTAMETAATHQLFLNASQVFSTNPNPNNGIAQVLLGDQPSGEQLSSLLPDGTYTVGLAYQNTDLNTVAVASHEGVKIDRKTETPVLISPAADSYQPNPIPVKFNLPEAAAPGTVKLKIRLSGLGFYTYTLTLGSGMETAGTHQFSIDCDAPVGGSNGAIVTAVRTALVFDPTPHYVDTPLTGSLPLDASSFFTQTFSIEYQDALLNGASSASQSNVKVVRYPPSIIITGSPVFYAGDVPDLTSFCQPGLWLAGVTTTTVQDPPVGTPLEVGEHEITFTVTDSAGQQTIAKATAYVRALEPAHHLRVLTGTAPVQAGELGGPPSDALLRTLGAPAVDDEGGLAYLATWTSKQQGKGAAIFRDETCVVKNGTTLSELGGATFRTFLDPVIDSGNLAFLATVSGPAARAAVVVSDAPSGALKIIARAGGEAPGTGGARFQSFSNVAVLGSAVAFRAELAPRPGHQRGGGIWMQDANHPLTAVLYEGQAVFGTTLKTVTVFQPGNGTPGQGRGWLSLLKSESDFVPAVSALVRFQQPRSAVVTRTIEGVEVIRAQTGSHGASGLALAAAGLASLGLPARADAGEPTRPILGRPAGSDHAGYSTFFGRMTAGPGGVTASDAAAVFAVHESDASPQVKIVARAGDIDPELGGKFASFQDPVVDRDGNVAFRALLKGGSLRRPLTSIWTKDTTGLALWAQSGEQAVELPDGVRWNAFTSLALGDSRGPIFSATTLPAGSGVWASDFEQGLRLIFHTGESIEGRKLLRFSTLQAVRGSMGVTRAFNRHGALVWLGTFEHGVTAIVQTEIP